MIILGLHNCRRKGKVVLKGVIELDRSNWRSRKSRPLKWLDKRQLGCLWCSSSCGTIKRVRIAFSSSCVRSRRVRDHVVLIHSMQIYSHFWGERLNFSEQMGNQCLTVAVDNWATPKMEEPQNLTEMLKEACGSISLHTCISEEVQNTTGRHSFCWKRTSQGGRTLQRSSPWSPNILEVKHRPLTGRREKQLF